MALTAESNRTAPAQQPVDRRSLGLTALSGLLVFAVSVGTWSPEGAPETGQAPAAQIRQFTADNAAALRVGAAAALVGSVLMVFFIAGLAQLVRRSRRGTLIPTMLVVCGSAAIIGTLYLAASASVFGFPHELEGVSDATVVAFYDAAAVAEWFMAFILVAPCMLLVAAFSFAAYRDRLMARWACLFGLAIAGVAAFEIVTTPFPGLGLNGLHLIVIFGWWLWPLAVGCALGWRWLRIRRG